MDVAFNNARDVEPLWPVGSCPQTLGKWEENWQQFSITVVFTRVDATMAALERARQLAHGLNAQVRILLPQVVPYILPLDRPPVDPTFLARSFCALADKETLELRVEVLLCRDLRQAVAAVLRPGSLVVIAVSRYRWFTRERSLARMLQRAGHHVLMVNRNREYLCF